MKSIHIGRPSAAVITAAAMIPGGIAGDAGNPAEPRI
jgi:hypothetical protein